jgi:hypothetical protein
MRGQSTRLFRAIVGLGLAAAGCGQVTPEGVETRDAAGSATRGHGDSGAATPDASKAPPDAATPAHDAAPDALAKDAGRDVVLILGFDAGQAHDAAMDVAISPPPPEIK